MNSEKASDDIHFNGEFHFIDALLDDVIPVGKQCLCKQVCIRHTHDGRALNFQNP